MWISLLILLILIDLVLFATDKYVLSFVLLVIGAIVGYYFVPDVQVFVNSVISKDGWMVGALEIGGAYLAIGVVVALIKWFLVLFSIGRHLTKLKDQFSCDHNFSYGEFAKYIHQKADYRKLTKYFVNDSAFKYFSNTDRIPSLTKDEFVERFTPMATNNIHRISFWVLQWPFVIITTLVEDLLLKLGKHVSEFIDFAFRKVSKAIIGDGL